VAERPWRHYRPSAWQDPLDPVLAELMPSYNSGRRRAGLDAVRRLAERAQPSRPPRRVVVVGTNGKSSVATYLARLLEAAGHSNGLYTSPHLRSWTERIRVGLEPLEPSAFRAALMAMHGRATEVAGGERDGDLRFFDVLTLAAEDVFGRAGVEFGIFEAGIGGRLDATRCVEPELVVLTGIGADHEQLLGHAPAERLREKALATPPGATLLSGPLDPPLAERLHALAAEHGFSVVDGAALDGEGFAARNLRLAQAAASLLLDGAPLPAIDTAVPGRAEHGTAHDVPYVVDVSHNPSAWRAFLDELPDRPHVAVVAITVPRPVDELARALAGAREKLVHVVTTATTVRPAQPPGELAAALAAEGLGATAVADPAEAFGQALELARERQLPLAVFGSNFVAVDFLAWARGA
jgi:dihydrofolate synthase/folylpolyglutamate synthase